MGFFVSFRHRRKCSITFLYVYIYFQKTSDERKQVNRGKVTDRLVMNAYFETIHKSNMPIN